jgi:WW domain-binding protein 11
MAPPHRIQIRPPGLHPVMLPPGLPPMHGPLGGIPMPMTMQQNPNVLSAPPSIMKPPLKAGGGEKKAVIEAKPQIKNVMADVTRFTPTALKVKRSVKGKVKQTGE